ncbi:S1/P1 nuclease [Rhizoctonia solani]|nr:S1/P1 nuclease [Rhizoctonia solani]
MRLSTLTASAALLATPAWSWGDEGHKMTAALAQIHLLPSARQAVCSILPSDSKCNLANIATWPDDIKKQPEWLWSAGLHFVNGIDDYPPSNCAFGTKGWTTDQNILAAIVNMTRNVVSSTGPNQDTSLRFLTHFLGDIHQPLHMTGRNLGGNFVPVLFNGKNTSLHFTWDDLLILERIKTLTNYTSPLPTSPDSGISPPTLIRNRQIESALNGSNYDPLVRWIVSEGIYGWWATELQEWTTCPQFAMNIQDGQQVIGHEKQPFEDPLDVPVCPYHWAKPSHQMLCDFIWRPDLEGVTNPKNAVYKIELNTAEYAGRVREEKMVEKQLAMGGMRLAAALNTVLGSEEELRMFGALPRVYDI